MKISSEQLSTGNPQAASPPRTPHTAPFPAKEISLQNVEQESIYPKEASSWVKRQGFMIVPNMMEALRQRAEGKLVVTLREADIAFRSKINMTSPLFLEAIKDGVINEDIPRNNPNSVYELRRLYNLGLKKIGDAKAKGVPAARLVKAETEMQRILDKMSQKGVPAHPNEVTKGFAPELTKPEFMTFDQYTKAAAATEWIDDDDPYEEAQPTPPPSPVSTD